MKCRYAKCKLGGEVAREDAVKNGTMYYHKECYEKNEAKKELREIMNKFPRRDVNISLSKAIDDSPHHVGFVKYIVKNKLSKFQNAYGLLYQMKIEDNYKEYEAQEGGRIAHEINQAIKNMDINEDPFEFEYKTTNKSKFDIY